MVELRSNFRHIEDPIVYDINDPEALNTLLYRLHDVLMRQPIDNTMY